MSNAPQPQVVATVISVTGMAFARGADGGVRKLAAGDVILMGETVFTVSGGQVDLAFSDGHTATILPHESYKFGAENMVATFPDAGEAAIHAAAEAEKVIAQLEQKDGDLLDSLDPTAAGNAGGGNNDGNSFVRLLRIVEPVTPVEYQFGTRVVEEIRAPEGDVIPEEDSTPNLVAPPTAQLDDDDVSGANGNPGGTGDDTAPLNTSGTLAGSGGDGDLDYYFSGGSTLPAGFSYNQADASTVQILQGSTVVLTITLNNETGQYSVVQNNPIDHPAGDTENNLTFNVGVYTQDEDGDQSTPVDITINVDDDTPGTSTPETATVEDEKASGGIDEADGGVGSVNGTIVDNVNWGADGFGSATGFSVGGQSFAAGTTVYWSQNGSFLGTNSTGAAASLVVNANGTYTYTLMDNLLLGVNTQGEQTNTLATVAITGVDGDGDTATVNVQLDVTDDIPIAVDDNALSLPEGGASTGGNVMTNDQQGADGAAVTHISLNGGTTWQLITSGALQPDGSYEFSEAGVGTYTFKADGTWTFTSVANVSGNTDASFLYRITDGDGDTDEALQPILVTDILPSTAYITVNTSNTGGGGATGQQQFEVIITNGDTTLAKTATLQDQEGQQDIPLTFDSAVQFQQGQTYTVVLDHISGSAHVNVTNFSITTSGGDVITLNGKGGNNNTTLIGHPDGTEDESTSFDGVIYNITGSNNPNGIQVSDPIGYDVNTVTGGDPLDDGKVLILQPALDFKDDFTLDFSDLPLNGSGQTDLFGVVNKVDISGDDDGSNTDSDNTIILTAQDVLDLGSGGSHTLFITGDSGDALKVSGTWSSSGTASIDGVDYEIYTSTIAGGTATIYVDTDLSKTGLP